MESLHDRLQAKDEQIAIYRQQNADMQKVVELLASRSVTVEVNTSAIGGNADQSRQVSIDGNVIGSTLNQGEMSGIIGNDVDGNVSS